MAAKKKNGRTHRVELKDANGRCWTMVVRYTKHRDGSVSVKDAVPVGGRGHFLYLRQRQSKVPPMSVLAREAAHAFMRMGVA